MIPSLQPGGRPVPPTISPTSSAPQTPSRTNAASLTDHAPSVGPGPDPTGLRRKQQADAILRHLGPALRGVLGDVNPLDGAINQDQRCKMRETILALNLRIELAVVDEHGNPNPADRAVLEDVYCRNFPPEEAIPVETIMASLRDRQEKGVHLDGKRFTICITGVLPGQPSTKENRRPVAFMQGGTLDAGKGTCVSFAEYWAVQEDFRGRRMLPVLMGINSAVSQAVARQEGKELKGTMWEMEAVGMGRDPFTKTRAEIYGRTGAMALMGIDNEGSTAVFHLQPDVTPDRSSGPVPLLLAFRGQRQDSGFNLPDLHETVRSYRDYFRGWADTNRAHSLPGISKEQVDEAFDAVVARLEGFTAVEPVPADQAPTTVDLALRHPEYAKVVADDFGLQTGAFDDPSVRARIVGEATRSPLMR